VDLHLAMSLSFLEDLNSNNKYHFDLNQIQFDYDFFVYSITHSFERH